ncbi:hypothetical protein F4782DRAFT_521768 [Xylaria castorea]|nr:hypothetical protein F4782DRAFT_521768 [Xylaria castorea]
MAAKKQQRMTIRYTENIAMLYLLHNIPALPSSNIKTNAQFKQTGYSLPFTEERRLAGVLAFLAHIEDDPNHIPAVCLHEIPEQHAMSILLAVNKSRPEDGRAYLSTIKGGFERIAATLSGVEDRAQDVERDVFAVIMELCKDRILYRLRLTKKKRDSADQTRTTIIDGLQKVVDYLSNDSSENTKLFLRKARNVIKLAVSLEKYREVQKLGEVVEAVNSLRQTEKFNEILSKPIPNRHVDPSVRCHLLNMIRKVSRYRESARILFLAAREFPLVRQMQVVVVELPTDAFNRPTISQDYRPTIHTTISRAPNLTKSEKDVKQMCDLLKISVKAADTEYGRQIRNTLNNSKIHAEIQLLYYYQIMLHGQLRLPRVICLSKSACWLCNAFILHHGKIYMPHSHGRLYPGWRLPDFHGGWFNDVAATFNQRLENVITESLKTLHRRRTKTVYPCPIESTLSTVTWLSVQPNDRKILDDDARNEELKTSSAVLVRDVIKSVEGITTVSQDETNLEKVLAKNTVLKDCASSDTPLSESPVSTVISGASKHSQTSGDTFQGPQENTRTYKIALGDISQIYPLGPLQLQFEYAGGHQQPTYGDNSPKQLLCTAQWLSREEFQHLKLRAGVAIDAGSLTSEEALYSTDATNNIYLSVESAVLKLTMQSVSSAADASSEPQESREAREKPASCAGNSLARVSALGSP